MSDTANPARLASAGEFAVRLKRLDEARWLATRYASSKGRELLVAIYLLNQELARALSAKEPMLGKIRLQWWRETTNPAAGDLALRRHDLSLELARVTNPRPDLIAPIRALIDAYDEVLDDHLETAEQTPKEVHETRALAVEGALMRVAGLALQPDASSEHLETLTKCGEAHLAKTAGLADADERWAAATTLARTTPASLWPALAHLAVARARAGTAPPLLARWRVFRAVLTRRL